MTEPSGAPRVPTTLTMPLEEAMRAQRLSFARTLSDSPGAVWDPRTMAARPGLGHGDDILGPGSCT